MRILSTATQLGVAFKNAARVREILVVLGEHGFADIVHRTQLSALLPSKIKRKDQFQDLPMPVRLRTSFEALGPTFVKLGQLLASRPDIIPAAFVEEFKKLQDDVASISFPLIREVVESELKNPLSVVFKSFDEIPMAAASIAQVHGAVLNTGEEVAVKIQRPGIEKTIHTDVSILRGLAELLEKYVPESRPFNPVGLVEEFFKSTLNELDFLVEANNLRRIRKNMEAIPKIAVPKVYDSVSTRKVLVQERFRGVRFSERERILGMGLNPHEIVDQGSRAFFHQVMHDGLFHGDLHAGNLFILDDGRIGMIDFGIVGRLSRRVQGGVVNMFLAIIDEDYETLATEYLYLCHSSGATNLAALQKDLMDVISPYVGMPLGEVNVGQLLLQSTTIAVRHNLQVPRELMLLFKAIFSIESLGKSLEPDFDILQVGHKLAKQLIVTQYTQERILRDLMAIGRDLQVLGQTLPRQMRLFFKRWTNDEYQLRFRNQDTKSVAHALYRLTRVLSYGILALGFFAVAAVLLATHQGPFIYGVSVSSLFCIMTGTVAAFAGIGTARQKEI
jgi:ubiquinone biosynthesis protein